MKDRYKAIGNALAAMEAEQSGWTIPDGVLRANLRDALSEDFLPPYEALLARNAAHSVRVSDKYIKYSVSDPLLTLQHLPKPKHLGSVMWAAWLTGPCMRRELAASSLFGVTGYDCSLCRWMMCAT